MEKYKVSYNEHSLDIAVVVLSRSHEWVTLYGLVPAARQCR